MIRLSFEGIQPLHSITLGPAEGFRVAGNFLRQLPTQEVLGQYARHQWHVRGAHFSRYDCREPCRVYSADAAGTQSRIFGRFAQLHVADGTMYASDALFAKFIDESVLWHSFELETYWPSLIITLQGAMCSLLRSRPAAKSLTFGIRPLSEACPLKL
jgi:hypothetical protein